MNGCLESNSFFLKLSSDSSNFLCQFFKNLPIYQINFHSVKISFYSLWNVSFLQWMDAWNQIHSSWNFLQILDIFFANFSNTYLFNRVIFNLHSVKTSFYNLWNVSFLQWMNAWNQIHSFWNFLQILDIFVANFSDSSPFTA